MSQASTTNILTASMPIDSSIYRKYHATSRVETWEFAYCSLLSHPSSEPKVTSLLAVPSRQSCCFFLNMDCVIKLGELHPNSKEIQLCSSRLNVLPRLKQLTKPQTVKIQGTCLFIYIMPASKYDLRQLSEHANNTYSQAPSYCGVLQEISLQFALRQISLFGRQFVYLWNFMKLRKDLLVFPQDTQNRERGKAQILEYSHTQGEGNMEGQGILQSEWQCGYWWPVKSREGCGLQL